MLIQRVDITISDFNFQLILINNRSALKRDIFQDDLNLNRCKNFQLFKKHIHLLMSFDFT